MNLKKTLSITAAATIAATTMIVGTSTTADAATKPNTKAKTCASLKTKLNQEKAKLKTNNANIAYYTKVQNLNTSQASYYTGEALKGHAVKLNRNRALRHASLAMKAKNNVETAKKKAAVNYTQISALTGFYISNGCA